MGFAWISPSIVSVEQLRAQGLMFGTLWILCYLLPGRLRSYRKHVHWEVELDPGMMLDGRSISMQKDYSLVDETSGTQELCLVGNGWSTERILPTRHLVAAWAGPRLMFGGVWMSLQGKSGHTDKTCILRFSKAQEWSLVEGGWVSRRQRSNWLDIRSKDKLFLLYF